MRDQNCDRAFLWDYHSCTRSSASNGYAMELPEVWYQGNSYSYGLHLDNKMHKIEV